MKGERKRQSESIGDSKKKQRTENEGDCNLLWLFDSSVSVCLGGVTDQVATALRKIRCYVGVPAKFNKAAKLLLNLLQEGHITSNYSTLFFEVDAS